MIKCADQPACTGMTGDTESETEWVSDRWMCEMNMLVTSTYRPNVSLSLAILIILSHTSSSNYYTCRQINQDRMIFGDFFAKAIFYSNPNSPENFVKLYSVFQKLDHLTCNKLKLRRSSLTPLN